MMFLKVFAWRTLAWAERRAIKGAFVLSLWRQPIYIKGGIYLGCTTKGTFVVLFVLAAHNIQYVKEFKFRIKKNCIWMNVNGSNKIVMIVWMASPHQNLNLENTVHRPWRHLSTKHQPTMQTQRRVAVKMSAQVSNLPLPGHASPISS